MSSLEEGKDFCGETDVHHLKRVTSLPARRDSLTALH
jgi:hypothetical protein